MRIPVVFSTDDNYVYFLCVTIASMKASGGGVLYDVYVLTDGLNEQSVSVLEGLGDEFTSITIIDVTDRLENECDLYSVLHITAAAYYRLLIPEVLEQYDKVIYLDSDLVVLSSLRELYEINIGEYIIAGAVDLPGKELAFYVDEKLGLDCTKYINSGVLLINCAAFKKYQVKEKAFELIKHMKDLLYPDQDLLNIICKDYMYILPGTWNAQAFKKNADLLPEYKSQSSYDLEHANIMHYSTHLKPWKWLTVSYGSYWWKYTAMKYYKYEKTWLMEQYKCLPVFQCNWIKKIMKHLRIFSWKLTR